MTGPCVRGSTTEDSCIAGLLFGAACCDGGSCRDCREAVARAARRGLSRPALERARAPADVAPRCPVCGHPSPAKASPDQRQRVTPARRRCAVCGGPVPPGRRTYCTSACYDFAEAERRREEP